MAQQIDYHASLTMQVVASEPMYNYGYGGTSCNLNIPTVRWEKGTRE